MSENKHTPGEWRVKSPTERQSVGAGETNVSVAWCGEASSSGAGGSYFVDRDECEANARLIAAAPDLLEALKLLANMGDAQISAAIRTALRPHERASFDEAVATARAAISKATGSEE